MSIRKHVHARSVRLLVSVNVHFGLLTRGLDGSYAANNDYIGFKRTIHDALHPGDDAPPLPNASTWFPESPRTVNTTTRNAGRQAADAGDDDDIDVLSERISIKCPITLVPMKDPVTSTKCPHSFERSAILDMLNQSAIRVGGSNRRGAQDGQQAVKCPVCEVVWTRLGY